MWHGTRPERVARLRAELDRGATLYEVVMNRKGHPCLWIDMPRSTLRIAADADTTDPVVEQVYDGQVLIKLDYFEVCTAAERPWAESEAPPK